MSATSATETFRAARDYLLEHREDYATACAGFRWPRSPHFNWALDWFDVIAEDNDRTALHIVEEDGTRTEVSFAEMAARSNRAANWMRSKGVAAGDRVLVVLGNQTELWETALAAMKLRAVVIPATPLLGPPTCATGSNAAGSGTSSYGRRTPRSSTRCPATTPGSRSVTTSRAGCPTGAPTRRPAPSRRTGRPTPTKP